MFQALYSSGEYTEDLCYLIQKENPVVWIDLFDPTKEEQKAIERWADISIPTRSEIAEIEQSSRLYIEQQALYMTVTFPVDQNVCQITTSPITFILAKNSVITVRYSEVPFFRTYIHNSQRIRLFEYVHNEPEDRSIFNPLFDAVIDHIADLIEKTIFESDTLSKQLFHNSTIVSMTRTSNVREDFSRILSRIGALGESISALRDSLSSFVRMIGFLTKRSERKNFGISEVVLATAERDVLSLIDHAVFVSNKISFLLEATLGFIDIEQNTIIKIFSVASVIFLPPTLLSSIWGMNYRNMPELDYTYGYPIALICIVFSSVLPYFYFKKKGWL